jgi:hypothetical protein
MKKFIIKLKALAIITFAIALNSCDLDINDNPNSPTGSVVTPDLTLPAVIASTVYNQTYYYSYAYNAFLVGYQLPGKGISGYGDIYTYDFTSTTDSAAWTRIFADLRDYNTIINKAENEPKYALFGGIAHILKAYSYQLLVDNYGDVPYTEGLKGGSGIVTPKYDKDSEVYQALVGELNEAISILKANKDKVGAGVTGLNAVSDPVFGGNLTKWIQFANNVKLRLLIRARGTSIDSFVQSAFSSFSEEGFLKEDVLVNPGYNASSQQNPLWTIYHSSVSGTASTAAQYYIPSKYLFSFYDGSKLSDNVRGALLYKGFPSTPAGQLADEANNPASTRAIWFIGTGTGASASNARGILKSRAAGSPLFLATETYFLLAEAALYNHALDGDAKTNFIKGIVASFRYLSLEGTATSIPSGVDPEKDVEEYIVANSGNYLANFDLATTTEQKLEAIITQKYIALNLLNGGEAWNEFRRTAYPKISGTSATSTFVSIRSISPRPDKLPIRLIYPQSEINLNRENVPNITSPFTNPIFWDKD